MQPASVIYADQMEAIEKLKFYYQHSIQPSGPANIITLPFQLSYRPQAVLEFRVNNSVQARFSCALVLVSGKEEDMSYLRTFKKLLQDEDVPVKSVLALKYIAENGNVVLNTLEVSGDGYQMSPRFERP